MVRRKVELSIEGKHQDVPLIGTAIRQLSALAGLPENEACAVELAVTEAVVNSIKHAYGNVPGEKVFVTFSLSDKALHVDVCDTGKPMDPKLLEEKPTAALAFDPNDLETVPASGRGLAIIRANMDKVTYYSSAQRNCLRMTKKLSGKPPAGTIPR